MTGDDEWSVLRTRNNGTIWRRYAKTVSLALRNRDALLENIEALCAGIADVLVRTASASAKSFESSNITPLTIFALRVSADGDVRAPAINP